MKNVLFLSSWFPSRVHTTLGNFVKYHAHSSAKFNNIFVLYIVADDSIKNYELVTSNENNLVITTVYFKRGFFKYFNYFKAFLIGLIASHIVSPTLVSERFLIPVIINPISPQFNSSISFGLGVNTPTFSTTYS